MAFLQYMKEHGSCGGHRKTSEGVINTATVRCNGNLSGVLHNDIRPENILLERHSDQFRVAFIDFALATRVSHNEKCKKGEGYPKSGASPPDPKPTSNTPRSGRPSPVS